MSVDMGALGRYVRFRRGQLGLLQSDIAEAMDRPDPWVSKLENGKITNFLPPRDVTALARVLQVTEDEIARAAGYEMPSPFAYVPDEYVELWAYQGDKLPDKAWAEIMEVVSKYHVDDEPSK